MIFQKTKIAGVFEVEIERKEDERGYFARTFCENELREKAGMEFRAVQSNRSLSKTKGTVRGMHFQKAPHWEEKLITCLQGAMYYIAADLRPDSPTHKEWVAIELSAEKKNMILIPKGCAGGSQTLTDNCEILYFMSDTYYPELASGINYKDPQFEFAWPLGAPSIISEKDLALPFYRA